MEVKGNKMANANKVIQIAIIAKISGNVNADETIGNRTTMKKMYSATGETLPFASSRATKFAIRQALEQNHNYSIDKFITDPQATEALRLSDSGRPDLFIDNDIFGYMYTKGKSKKKEEKKESKKGSKESDKKGEGKSDEDNDEDSEDSQGGEISSPTEIVSDDGKGKAFIRRAPVSFSHFKALRDTPIKSEFCARFPRDIEGNDNPVPFEVEIAEFIGRLDVLIYDYIGDFTKFTTKAEKTKSGEPIPDNLSHEERCKRLEDFLDVLLTPSYVLPRRTNSLCIPEYYAALVCFSEKGPLPIYQSLDYVTSVSEGNNQANITVDRERVDMLMKRFEGRAKFYLVDYLKPETQIPDIIKEACTFLFPSSQNDGR
jgi:CRISPR-associated autoregulator DevR family